MEKLEPKRINGELYSGENYILLSKVMNKNNLNSPYWGTFDQWKDQGVPVRKGSKCMAKIKVPTGRTYRSFPVFHVSQKDNPIWVILLFLRFFLTILGTY